MDYEFRHLHPSSETTTRMLLESDRTALSFAHLMENGVPIEVYAGGLLIGRVEPTSRRDVEPKTRRAIALPA